MFDTTNLKTVLPQDSSEDPAKKCDIMSEAAMRNAYYISHNVQVQILDIMSTLVLSMVRTSSSSEEFTGQAEKTFQRRKRKGEL